MLADHAVPDTIPIEQFQIGRTKRHDLYTRIVRKLYKPVFTKGRIMDEYEIRPYGWKEEEEEPVFNNHIVSDEQPCCSNSLL